MLENLKGYEIMLVSHSPRRQELLQKLGVRYCIGESVVAESYPEGLDKREIPVYLSRQKAIHCRPKMQDNTLVIAADTIVWIDGSVLGKPNDPADAQQMLRLLSGRTHFVVTGVTLRTAYEERSFFAETEVAFTSLSEEEINYYIETYHPFDKAGAYGIQEWIGMIGVSGIKGSYYNVMGLPLFRLYEELKRIKPCC